MEKIFYLFGIVLFIVLFFFEKQFEKKRVKKQTRIHSYKTNICILAWNNIVLFFFSTSFLYAFFHNWSFGILHIFENKIFIFIVSFLLYDFLIYVWHYINHKWSFLWEFHKAHHSDVDLNVTTGFRFHIGELIYSILYKSLTIIIFGFSIEFIIFFEFIILYFSLFHHTNFAIPFEKYIQYLIVVPSHHCTHHGVEPKEHHSNFGVVFSFWDKMFGTYNKKNPIKFGLENISEQNFFQNFLLSFEKVSVLILFIFIITCISFIYFL